MEDEADLYGAFQDSLNCALVRGLRPSRWTGLGDETCTAIEAIAREHPEATADHIADAYDAFAREHAASPVKLPPVEPPKLLVAQRDRFKRR
jgi:hypothetical protein